MHPDSRQTIHMGINFVIAPTPSINMQTHMKFQQSLFERGIEFAGIAFKEREITVERQEPTHFVVRVLATEPPAIGQLLVLAPQPGSPLGLFAREAEAVVEAFNTTWPVTRQIVSSDVAFRDLYETTSEHAFQELWEERLGQPGDALKGLGWSTQGGGFRFVVPPSPNDSDPVEIELRIESYLRDSKKIWVETIFKWIKPMSMDTTLDPKRRLHQVDNYVEGTVVPFMMKGSQ